VLADSDIQAIEDLEEETIGGVAGSHKMDIMTQYIEDKSLDIEIRTYENLLKRQCGLPICQNLRRDSF